MGKSVGTNADRDASAGRGGRSGFLHVVGDATLEVVEVELRLNPVGIRTGLAGGGDVAGFAERAEDDDRQVRGGLVRADLSKDLEAVHPWHRQVQQHQVRPRHPQVGERIVAVVDADRPVAVTLEQRDNRAAQVLTIVDNEYSPHDRLRASSKPPVARPAASPVETSAMSSRRSSADCAEPGTLKILRISLVRQVTVRLSDVLGRLTSSIR